ncbi:hypothetical protein S83_070695, partial [Arachis hypogaea]
AILAPFSSLSFISVPLFYSCRAFLLGLGKVRSLIHPYIPIGGGADALNSKHLRVRCAVVHLLVTTSNTIIVVLGGASAIWYNLRSHIGGRGKRERERLLYRRVSKSGHYAIAYEIERSTFSINGSPPPAAPERCENMIDYIKRLKVCIRWFQDIEMRYSLQQERLKNSLELTQQKCMEIELLLKIKEDELNSEEIERKILHQRRIEDDPKRSGISHLHSIIQGVNLQANHALKPLFERQ